MKRHHNQPIDISVHDSSQLEFKTLYRIPEGVPLGGDISFVQDVYMFIPRSMGVNQDTYTKDLFFRSLTNYIRIKTPKFLGDEERRHCRIDRILPRLAEAASLGRKPSSVVSALSEVRMFGAYLNDQFKILSSYEDPSEISASFEEVAGLLRAYREIMDKVTLKLNERRWQSVAECFRYVDEFLSHRLEECVVDLVKKGIDCAGGMRPEFERRDKMGYLQVQPHSDEQTREQFAFRMGSFKKYISEVLYLEVKRFKRERLFTNLAAGTGAAVAALVNSLADPNQRTSLSGNFVAGLRDSLPLMLVVVSLVYVTKDRIKEYMRENFMSWLKPWIPDYSFQIKSKQGRTIGRCQEEMNFVSRTKVPADIKQNRYFSHETPLPSNSYEEVLHYRRSLKLNRIALEGLLNNTNSLKDILRFDFNPFLAKLSNPLREEHFVDRDLRLHQASLPKVYHVNVVIRQQIYSKESGQLATSYVHVRTILDKNGIKRIEGTELEIEDAISSPTPVQQRSGGEGDSGQAA